VVRADKQIAATSEATDWFVRFLDDGMSRHDRMRYLCWLKQSPVHVAETLRLMRICRLLHSFFLPRSDADAEDAPPCKVVDGNRSVPHRPH
jgi:ferric-dicitrate binding protein FerR (iron transport regulator)